MGNLLAYSGLTTKIRAMQGTLLNDADIRQIADFPSVSDLMVFLSRHPGYKQTFQDLDPQTLHRGDLEALLSIDTVRDFMKIYHFAGMKQRRFLNLYFMHYEVKVLKRYLCNFFGTREHPLSADVFPEAFTSHTQLDLDRISKAETIDEFISALRDTCYYEPLQLLHNLENLRLFDYEMCLDHFLYSQVWNSRKKYFKGDSLDVITHCYGTEIDLLNLTWIYRAKKYYQVSSEEIYSFLIPGNYKLHKTDIKQLVESETLQDYHTVLSKTYYGRYLHTNDPGELEHFKAKTLDILQKKEFKQDPYSLAAVNTYLYLKEKDYAKIITAAECIRYGFSPQDILTQLAAK